MILEMKPIELPVTTPSNGISTSPSKLEVKYNRNATESPLEPAHHGNLIVPSPFQDSENSTSDLSTSRSQTAASNRHLSHVKPKPQSDFDAFESIDEILKKFTHLSSLSLNGNFATRNGLESSSHVESYAKLPDISLNGSRDSREFSNEHVPLLTNHENGFNSGHFDDEEYKEVRKLYKTIEIQRKITEFLCCFS